MALLNGYACFFADIVSLWDIKKELELELEVEAEIKIV